MSFRKVTSPCLRFNGAVTLRSRKRCRRISPLCTDHRLQWGRDLAVTETLCVRSYRRVHVVGFNGAVTLRSRKRSEP